MVFSAKSGFFIPAERRVRWVLVVGIDPYPASLDRPGDPKCPVDVGGMHGGPESIDRIIGDLDCLGLVFERNGTKDRSKDFFLGDPRIVVHVGKQRRLDEKSAVKAVFGKPPSARYKPRLLLFADLDVAHDFL